MSIDWAAVKVVADVIQWLIVATIGIYVWWTRRWTANARALGALGDRIDDNARRLDAVEHDLRHAPGHEDITSLRKDVSGLRADMREMNGTLRGLTRAVDLVIEHMVNRGSKQ